jgi:hypothetical protein
MAKRGETRPHRVRFEWANGVKGCETFTSRDRANDFMDQLARTATQSGLEVTFEYTLSTKPS